VITGHFGTDGKPYVKSQQVIPSLSVRGDVEFLLDTGSDRTSLHPLDSLALRVPYAQLGNPMYFAGIGGSQAYFTADAALLFRDEIQDRLYFLRVAIARPSQHNLQLPSLLGQDILRHWRTIHDPTERALEFTVRRSDGTVMLQP